ncbi:hypothetical protein J32TS6_25580 [Virgibacillus pantothenticus]|nr:hypothetical protein J32TS6_25580 [Virgibacillus pantothenticus]
MTRARYQIVRQITKEKQRFLQYLSTVQYIYRRNRVFGKAMMDLFLENYSLEELSQMSLKDLDDYLQSKGKQPTEKISDSKCDDKPFCSSKNGTRKCDSNSVFKHLSYIGRTIQGSAKKMDMLKAHLADNNCTIMRSQ